MHRLNSLIVALFGAVFFVSCMEDAGYMAIDSPKGTDDTIGYISTQGDDDSGTISTTDSDTDEVVDSGYSNTDSDSNKDENTGPADSGSGVDTQGGQNTDTDKDSDSNADKDGDGWFVDFDCDDNNPNVNPDVEELPGNYIDDDCDGEVDEEDDTDWDDSCATQAYESKLKKKPSDIIFILDNSGSMGLEAKWVQENMNDFSKQIAGSGVDYRVIVISSYPDNENGICIAPPLGSGGCPYKDTKLSRFMHVNQKVESTNGLSLFLATYPLWMFQLRPNSAKHIVIVSDDNSSMPALGFQLALKALGGNFTGYKFHGIFCYTHCSSAASVGSVYRTLVNRTGGVSGDLCLQNFKPVFDKLATAVVKESKISCKIPMPKAPAGKKINLEKVSIEVVPSPGSPAQEIPNVDGPGQCGGGGWYYNNNTNPTKIILCPSTCDWAQSLTDAELTVDSGCLEPVV